MTDAGRLWWQEVLGTIAGLLPPGAVSVLVDGASGQAAMVADRLAAAVRATGRPCARLAAALPSADQHAPDGGAAQTVVLADSSGGQVSHRWDVLIWLRTPPAAAGCHGDGEAGADIVIDLHDPAWPVIRRVGGDLAGPGRWYISETRAFFAPRAATWDTKFSDDLPAYAAAIAEARIPRDAVVIDVGCGTGRALPALRQAVGPGGAVIAVDLTPEMLGQARAQGRAAHAALIVAAHRFLAVATRR
jgi:hypothetical protein